MLDKPGVSKTHLAVALGMKACAQGYRVPFTTAMGLVVSLEKALKLPMQARLLIIDEIGYIPIDRQRAIIVFQLVSRRDEWGALILTSNQSLST